MQTIEELSRHLARINAAGMGLRVGRGDGPYWRSHALDLVEAHIRHAKLHPADPGRQAQVRPSLRLEEDQKPPV